MANSLVGLQLVSLVVPSYDEAIAFFVDKLGFDLLEDSPAQRTETGEVKRWVVVRPPTKDGSSSHAAGILLATPSHPAQYTLIGKQWGDRVGLFWRVDDFDGTYARLKGQGVKFRGEPRDEPYGSVVVFEDAWGNIWDLLGPRRA